MAEGAAGRGTAGPGVPVLPDVPKPTSLLPPPPAVGESSSARWARRRRTIPAMLGITLGLLVFAPVLAPAAVVVDVLHGRRRLPTLRTYGVALQYAVNDSVEIFLAPLLWARAGFGRRLDAPASIARHARLQLWSLRTFSRRAEQLLGVRFQVEGEDAVLPTPAIVLARHVNLFDASLPAWLYQVRHGRRVLAVLMRDLLADPGFDLIYQRLDSVFVMRDAAPEAREAIRAMAARIDDGAVGVIFPEGRLFRPELVAPLLGRLEATDPERATRLAALRHLLPPRPGGVLAMLEGAPHADIVVLTHTGFDAVASFGQLRTAAPLRDPIEVRVRRIARQDVPTERREQVRWLDELWLQLDAELDGELAERSAP